jgi:RHS repeat-associated protein
MWIPLKKYHFRPLYPHFVTPKTRVIWPLSGGFSTESNVYVGPTPVFTVYRLTCVDYNDGNDMSFYYDALGNRRRTINGGTVNYQTNNLNQYTSVAGTSYTYDDNGNLAFDGQLRYYYDCESRLIDINDANDAPVASYAYDYLGRRISRTIYGSPNVTIQYAYDGDRIIAEYDGSGTLLRKFIYGPGLDEPICLLEVAENNAVYYYHFDGRGSVVALSDVNSVLVERYTYDVFGRPTIRDANGTEITASAFANPYLFTGRAYDAETGLYYYRARYYDYATGRFLQPDPMGYQDGLNLYTYVQNNPARWADPYGLLTGVEEGTTVTLWTGWGFGGYLTGAGTFISRTGVGVLVVGTAAVSGTVGYGIGKYIVCPALDFVADKLYDPIVNRGKLFPSRKRAKDAARRCGKGTPEHDGPHPGFKYGHFHAVDENGNRYEGKDNFHFEHPEFIPPIPYLPDDDPNEQQRNGDQ